ncbi:MAG: hypothetical protein JWO06_3647 [Bacteroidota bacterium]|nr:hypothetical protein [Bacteroidota bacterium]
MYVCGMNCTKSPGVCLRIVFALLFQYAVCGYAQITENIPATQFNDFTIKSEQRKVGDKSFLFVTVLKSNAVVLMDSVSTDVKSCTGFSVPPKQPIKDYFVFTKRERKNGRTYILTREGQWAVIPGGTFWAAPKHKLLFILAERDNVNLMVYDLKQMKTLVEKFNCDEFTGWYYHKGNYLGKVVMECGEEPEAEKEISEWMHPVIIEKYNVKTQTVGEVHTTEGDLERAKPLARFAGCK